MSRARFNPLDQVICLERPHWQVPSCWTEHVPFVMYLTGALAPQTVVELGAGDGALYLGICQAIESLKLDAEAFAVRPRPGDGAADDEALAAMRGFHERRYSRFSRLLNTTTDDAASLFDAQSIDLLHIVGGRELDLVARDFQTWRVKMSRYGLVLIDDVTPRSGDLGVSEFWDDLRQRFSGFTFDHGPGLGVLAVGEDAAASVERLVRADGSEVHRIRRFFSSLGRLQRECAATLHDSRADSSRLLIRTGLQADRIERLTAALRDSRRRLTAANERLSILDERSASLTWRVADRISRSSARIAPRGSKRRSLLRFGYHVLRSARRLGSREGMAGLVRSYTEAVRGRLPGKMAGRVRDWLQFAVGFIRFQWEIHFDPPSIPRFDSIQASIIIPDSHQARETLACLKSIASHVPGITFEVIAVSGCSTKQISRTLGRIPGLVVAGSPQNTDFAGSCERGAAMATGKYLVFLRNTATVTECWLAALAATFQDLPRTGLVVPKLLHPDGRLKVAGGLIEGGARGSGRWNADDPEHPRCNYVRELDSCSPACMMIPRSLFSQVGGFDCELNSDEDASEALVLKVRRAGYDAVYQPAARIILRESVARGRPAAGAVTTLRATNKPHFGNDNATRSMPTGRVLVIDYSLPTPDRDAGSFRMVEILKAIRASGNHVGFVPADLTYDAPYAQNLQRIGVEVAYQPYYPSVPDYLEQHGEEFDLVILSRADIASRFVESVRTSAPRAKLVFDTVDLHFLREERAAELLNSSSLRRAARRRKRQELALASQCDATLVVSPVEKGILEKECPGIDVRILSTIMDVPTDEPPGYEDRQHLVFIGGLAWPPNVDAVVYFVQEILPLIVARLPDLVFQVVGSNTPEEIRNLAGKNVRILGYVADVKPIFDKARVAVAPLRFGAGVKGKVNQSMALGVPTVVSPIAAEGMHLVHEQSAMIADDPVRFADAVVRLWTSRTLWERISVNGRANVREHFSVESASRQLEELLAFAGLGARAPSRHDMACPTTSTTPGDW